jgi:hypothetical protein
MDHDQQSGLFVHSRPLIRLAHGQHTLRASVSTQERLEAVGVAARQAQKLHCREAFAFGWAGVDCSEPRPMSDLCVGDFQ